jgi:hypothetical protein
MLVLPISSAPPPSGWRGTRFFVAIVQTKRAGPQIAARPFEIGSLESY